MWAKGKIKINKPLVQYISLSVKKTKTILYIYIYSKIQIIIYVFYMSIITLVNTIFITRTFPFMPEPCITLDAAWQVNTFLKHILYFYNAYTVYMTFNIPPYCARIKCDQTNHPGPTDMCNTGLSRTYIHLYTM